MVFGEPVVTAISYSILKDVKYCNIHGICQIFYDLK